MKETAYPVWFISARWDEDGCKNNHTSFRRTYRREYTLETMQKKANQWWDKYKIRKLKDKHPILRSLYVEFEGCQIWLLVWFSHKSLNYFATEKEAFMSFQRWLDERDLSYFDDSLGHTYKIEDKDEKEVCLMGAEDRWRWKFCGCNACKRLRITIINH